MDAETRRGELGGFLRALRSRSTPESFGFPAGQRRRTQGLRREEVAQLAAISPTWYTWIEQGREVMVSPDVLDRLARALRMTATERVYLFEMAGRRDPGALGSEEDAIPEGLVSLLSDMPIPAYLMGRYWDMLAWNAAASELFCGWLDQAPPAVGSVELGEPPPNLLRFVFLRPESREFVVDWASRAKRLCAEFRADCRSRLEEPRLQWLVEELKQGSPEFALFWKQHDVLERQGGERSFRHPYRGLVSYRQLTLRPVEMEHLKLVLLKPEGMPEMKIMSTQD